MAKIDYTTGKGYTSIGLLNLKTNIINEARTDINELSGFGITEELLQKAEEKAEELRNLPTSEQDRYAKVDATKAKRERVVELKQIITLLQKQLGLHLLGENVYGDTTLKKRVDNLKFDRLLDLAQDFERVLIKSKTDISTYGITDEKINQLNTIRTDVEKRNLEQIIVFSDSFKNTVRRSELKKELYDLLNYISGIGKFYWKNKDARKYKRYLISISANKNKI